MNINLFLAVFDNVAGIFKEENEIGFGKACLLALLAIIIVFAILVLIILAINLLRVCLKAYNKNKKAPEVKEAPKAQEVKNTNIEDDDMMAAVLVATIDYTNETKKDVRLKSVKRIG